MVEFFIDAGAYPVLAKGIKDGHIENIDVAFKVGSSECSICGNVATRESEWCHHIRFHNGQIIDDRVTSEIIHNVTFTGLSLITEGAFLPQHAPIPIQHIFTVGAYVPTLSSSSFQLGYDSN